MRYREVVADIVSTLFEGWVVIGCIKGIEVDKKE
jgi:hypothetical protein